MIDPEQGAYEEFRKGEEDKITALIAKVQRMEEPDLFKPTMSREEEEAIFAKRKFKKSDLKIVVGRGTICRCNHGKVKHIRGRRYETYNASRCTIKSCKCDDFIPKIRNY